MSGKEFTQQRETLQHFLEVRSRWAGRESGFVQRQSKVTAVLFVQILVLGLLEKGTASLQELVEGGRRPGVRVSASGLAQRMNERGVKLLRRLVQAGIEQFGESLGADRRVLGSFAAVHLLDSTPMSLPKSCSGRLAGSGGNASSAGAKIQVVYEYLTGMFKALEVGSSRVSDQRCLLAVSLATPNSLKVFDLGYVKLASLAAIANQQAFFLTRLNTTLNVYWQATDSAKANLLDYLHSQLNPVGAIQVYLGAATRLPVRLVYRRLPTDQLARAQRRALSTAQKHGRVPSATHQAFLGWQLCITHVPAARWSPTQTLLVYRLRWQIELVFKLWKSCAALDGVRCQRPDHFLCLLYARLLGLLVFQWLLSPLQTTAQAELSATQAFHLFQRAVPSLIRRIAKGWLCVTRLLARFAQRPLACALKSSRPLAPSTRQRLLSEGVS